ncbi:MAG: cysteine desulfurase [Candidatus Aminicenantes bacterium]|nr:cysteine desulfurase [Candidatus Aminicenantes bacterium]
MRRRYFDHIAATPVHPDVTAALLPFLGETFGNPQSLHTDGQTALAAVEEAREKVAALLGAKPEEILFTSSGSESNNFAVKGIALANEARGKHLVVSAVEHPSVLNPAKSLEKRGFRTTIVPVDRFGRVDPADVEKALTPETILVSVMTAVSEVGTIEPVGEIARLCRARKVLVHTDAVAAAGSIPIDVKALDVDALSLSANQFYGPRGAAAVYVRKGVRVLPLVEGGLQEGGRRAGSEDVPAVVGMGRAAALAVERLEARRAESLSLRDRLIAELPRRVERVILTGHPTERLPHHASFCVEFIEGEAMLLHLDMKGISVSSGSACTSKSLKASHVLLAMGLDHALAQGSVVFSLVEDTPGEDVDYVLDVFPPIIDRLRTMSPLWTKFLQEKT